MNSFPYKTHIDRLIFIKKHYFSFRKNEYFLLFKICYVIEMSMINTCIRVPFISNQHAFPPSFKIDAYYNMYRFNMSILSVALYKFPINKNITCNWDDLCVNCAKYKRNIKRIDTRATLSNVLTSGKVLIYSRFEIYTCKNDCRNLLFPMVNFLGTYTHAENEVCS